MHVLIHKHTYTFFCGCISLVQVIRDCTQWWLLLFHLSCFWKTFNCLLHFFWMEKSYHGHQCEWDSPNPKRLFFFVFREREMLPQYKEILINRKVRSLGVPQPATEHQEEIWEALHSLHKPGYSQGGETGLQSRATSKFPWFIVAERPPKCCSLLESYKHVIFRTRLLSYRCVYHISFMVHCRSRKDGSAYTSFTP